MNNPNRDERRKEKSMKKTMKTWTRRVILGAFITMNLALGAAEPPVGVPSKDTTWTLKTDDTHLELTVRDDKPFITVLKNPAQGWNWTPKPSEVPLLAQVVVGNAPRPLTWSFREASTAADKNGTTLTLRFTSADPALELKSVWRARPGVGPVEHQPTIRNDTTGEVSFAGDYLVAAQLNLVSDQQAHLFPVANGRHGYGETLPQPYQMIQVGTAHGVYLAYDYSCGQFASTVTSNQISSYWRAVGIKNTVTATGATFHCPGIMIQTYQGDEDDGANHFRKWFWNYEITPSLRNNPNEPPIGYCASEPKHDGDASYLLNFIKTNDLASWGIGYFKTDFWHWDKGHARSDEIAAALHAKGIKLCMYFNGKDMVAKPDDQVALTILLDEAKKSKFDYYRSDTYMGPMFVDLSNYHSVESFKRRLEVLAKAGVGWENCSNGGNVRSLDVCRRMTFMTHSDHSGLGRFFNNVYHWSYMICPIQLKSDYGIAHAGGGDDIATIRGYLLGAALGGPNMGEKAGWNRIEDIKKVFHLYNTKQRAILRGADVYHILPKPTVSGQASGKRVHGGEWFGLQYYNTFINKGSVLLWQNGGPASQVIKLKGLDRNATYTLTFEDATGKNGSMTGAKLMDDGIEVPMGPNASEIIWIENPNGKPESKPAAP